MQRPSDRLSFRIRTTLVLVAGVLGGAIVIFALISVLSGLLGVRDLPEDWRVGLAAAGLLALASLDVRAARRKTYCPLGWRRQTPKRLLQQRSATVVVAAWGLDLGLAITTIRVAALTWGVVLLSALGLSPVLVGVGYGLSFALPLFALIWTHRVGRTARAGRPSDPGLEAMLARRESLQMASAALLSAAGASLIVLVVLA